MKIELESPYKEMWRKGYLVTNTEGRRNIILFNSRSERTTVSYARYLMSVSLGYFVPPEYEVDHIDDDKTNDILSNLQLLSSTENKKKQASKTRPSVCCVICGVVVVLKRKQKGQKTCSRVCGGKLGALNYRGSGSAYQTTGEI